MENEHRLAIAENVKKCRGQELASGGSMKVSESMSTQNELSSSRCICMHAGIHYETHYQGCEEEAEHTRIWRNARVDTRLDFGTLHHPGSMSQNRSTLRQLQRPSKRHESQRSQLDHRADFSTRKIVTTFAWLVGACFSVKYPNAPRKDQF